MTKVIIDQEARDRIQTDLTTNFLIEAGAGSGKTTSLVARLVNLIYTGTCEINKVVAITFTRKAADELKLRFQSELEKKWQDETEVKERKRLETALENIEQCFIGTVHAFCAKLLRERPIEARLDINFQELEVTDDHELLEEAWLMNLNFLQENHDPILMDLIESGIRVYDLLDSFKRIKNYPDVEWVTTDVKKPDLLNTYQSFSNLIQEAGRLLPAEEPKNNYDSFQKTLVAALRKMRHLNESQDKEIIAVFELFNKNLKPTFNRWDPEFKEDVRFYSKKLMGEFEKDVLPLLQAWREYCHPKIIAFLSKAMEAYEKLKRERSLLNFQDLLLKTNELVKENAEVRRYFQKKYQYLLVDEFQDTDPLQAEIMFFLTSEDSYEKVWTKCTPKQGSLFVVGDPKQAIYRFRRADIDTYNRVKQLIKEHGGEVLQLTMNFRTVETITENLDTVFEKLLPEQETKYQAAFRPLNAYQVADPMKLNGLKKITVPADYKKKDAIVAKDAKNIALYIHNRIKEGFSARDFMVLNRYNEGVATYAQTIEAFGIPVSISGEIIIGEMLEFRDFMSLLKTFVDPADSLAFVATLRSVFFGISDDDLYQWKEAGGGFTIYSSVPDEVDDSLKDKYSIALNKLTTYQKWIRMYSPILAIEKIMENVGFYTLLLSHQLGKRAQVSLLQILERLKTAEANGITTYKSIYDLFSEMVMNRTEVANLEQETDAVRVMNIHKAKGLEAPIVFLAHPFKKVNPQSLVSQHIKRQDQGSKGYFSFSMKNNFSSKTLALPSDWEALRDEELKYMDEEEKRIVYVAATRAGKALILSSSTKSDSKNPWQDLLEIREIEPIEVDEEELMEEGDPRVVSLEEYRIQTRNQLEWLEASKMANYEMWSSTEGKEILVIEREAGGGKEWGTFIHEVLEKVVKGQEVQPFIRNRLGLYKSLEREPEVNQYINQFKESVIWDEIETADEILTEVPFNMKISEDHELYSFISKEKQEKEVYATGVIDLIYKVGEKWVIVDYKTDRFKDEDDLIKLRNFYQGQVDFYQHAWEFMTGEKVDDAKLFFFENER